MFSKLKKKLSSRKASKQEDLSSGPRGLLKKLVYKLKKDITILPLRLPIGPEYERRIAAEDDKSRGEELDKINANEDGKIYAAEITEEEPSERDLFDMVHSQTSLIFQSIDHCLHTEPTPTGAGQALQPKRRIFVIKNHVPTRPNITSEPSAPWITTSQSVPPSQGQSGSSIKTTYSNNTVVYHKHNRRHLEQSIDSPSRSEEEKLKVRDYPHLQVSTPA